MGFRDRLAQYVSDVISDAQTINAGNVPTQTPAPRVYPLDTQVSVKLDGSGNGIASCGPQIPRQHWQPSAASVSVGTNTLEAQCSVYYGTTIGMGTFLGQTPTGSTGDTCGIAGIDLPPGAQIWAKWTGGDPNSTATMVVKGQQSSGAIQ